MTSKQRTYERSAVGGVSIRSRKRGSVSKVMRGEWPHALDASNACVWSVKTRRAFVPAWWECEGLLS